MQLSRFGKRFTNPSGIQRLMQDLGEAFARKGQIRMLGGGNPAHVPEAQARFHECIKRILDDPDRFRRVIGDYDPPHGNREFVEALASLLRKEFGWDIHPENIALTLGSQTAFFTLFNMFAGEFEDGSRKQILLPLAPEYIGYADLGLSDDFFTSFKPEIEELGDQLFKYHVNFDAIRITDRTGAICVSRPTNPTGNVLTNEEIERLAKLARDHNVPFIIDNAYGMPFPNVVYTDARPYWDENTILCMSLSKLGLPTSRTGIVIADAKIAAAVAHLNAILSLAPAGLGASIALDLVLSGELIRMSREIIRPFYQKKAEFAVERIREEMRDIPYLLHKPEGAFFLWLWFRDLPITSMELYERLKDKGVLVVPGNYFFPGLKEEWRHRDECIRVSYVPGEETVAEGIRIIAEEARRAYAE